MSAEHVLHGEVEAPRPLRAFAGKISLAGWCLVAGLPEAPAVRLATAAGTLTACTRVRRNDVPALLPHEPAAGDCGFVLTGSLPAGVHEARFEARLPDGSWRAFKRLSLAIEPAPFAAALDTPLAHGTLRDRVKVGGWALDPAAPLREVTLRYGHREIACVPHPRADVAALFPAVPHAGKVGFVSEDFLVAGHGPVRIRARLADGRIAIAPTPLTFSVATDENHGTDLDLTAARIPLPAAPVAAPAAPPPPAAQLRNILFVLYGSFDSNSALHVAALANELAAAGHACAVAVPHGLASLAHLHAPHFRALLHDEAAAGVTFPNGRGPDLIHAWTTRENVRRLTETLRARHRSRVIVHLEDNEQEILALALGRSRAELEQLPAAELDRLVPDDLSHPHRSREFLAGADGVTLIAEPLREFVPAGRPVQLLWPAADARYFGPRPLPEEFRALLRRRPDESILCYHGNVHAANAAEVRELYAAVLQLNEAGEAVLLLRSGVDTVDFLGDLAPRVAPHVLNLGQILHHHHLPPLLALADCFVQPGRDDAFNRYRFPSKLPEFFALGRPVILPRTNLGTAVRHGTDAWVLDQADAAGIASAVTALRRDPALAARLAAGAAAFSAQHFSWPRSAAALAKFYGTLAVS